MNERTKFFVSYLYANPFFYLDLVPNFSKTFDQLKLSTIWSNVDILLL